MNRLIAFGSSPIMALDKTIVPYPKIIADQMGLAYDSQAKPLTSNSKIARNDSLFHIAIRKSLIKSL